MRELKQGDRVKAIWWSSGGAIKDSDDVRLTVSMQDGQMSGVPWIEAFDKLRQKTVLHNCALLEGIELYPEGHNEDEPF